MDIFLNLIYGFVVVLVICLVVIGMNKLARIRILKDIQEWFLIVLVIVSTIGLLIALVYLIGMTTRYILSL
jgi:Na+/H+-dicarboxylate symporter